MKTKRTQFDNRLRRYLLTLFYLAIGLQLLVSCSVLQTTHSPVTESASLQNQRSANAFLDLLDLQEIDALIKLDNHWLANQFENVLNAQAELDQGYSFRKIKIYFNKQIIGLESLINVKDKYGSSITATLQGDIVLKYRGSGLEWRPRFTHLQIDSKNFSYNGDNFAEADPELTETILSNLNASLAKAFAEN